MDQVNAACSAAGRIYELLAAGDRHRIADRIRALQRLGAVPPGKRVSPERGLEILARLCDICAMLRVCIRDRTPTAETIRLLNSVNAGDRIFQRAEAALRGDAD